LVGHEFMHAFDVFNVDYEFWEAEEVRKEYTKRALCLRRSHRSVLSLSGQDEALDDTIDSENLGDLVGTMIAYAAFAALPEKIRIVRLSGLNMSSEQLFFINHCIKWCSENSGLTERYAPFRSRCIVPLMNMPEFSRAFGCAPGTLMNPQNKCAFW
ncbi:hypothetical protein MTO96_041657, partial [Rhipicephalus appendiculatus]